MVFNFTINVSKESNTFLLQISVSKGKTMRIFEGNKLFRRDKILFYDKIIFS